MKPPPLASEFAFNVRRLLNGRDPTWSQGELARQLGVSAGVVSRMISGNYAPTGATIAAVAEALGVQPHELILPIDEKPKPKKKRGRNGGCWVVSRSEIGRNRH